MRVSGEHQSDAVARHRVQDPAVGRVCDAERDGASGGRSGHLRVLVARLVGVAGAAPVSYTHLDVYKRQAHKRDAEEWVSLLNELAAQLANGQFYNRDLPIIDVPLSRLVERYLRRRS